MKKTYISPDFMVVQMRPLSAILIVSNPDIGFGSTSVDANNVEVNEYKGVSDVNVWDSEW